MGREGIVDRQMGRGNPGTPAKLDDMLGKAKTFLCSQTEELLNAEPTQI